MALRKKKTLLDQASDVVETVRPQVESAAVTAKEAVQEFVETTAKPAIKDARAKAGPVLADARDKAAPVVAAGTAKASKKAAKASKKASKAAKEAREAASAAVAQARGEQPKKKGRLKKLALFAAVAGVVGYVANKVRGGKESDNWQSSYVPTPAPAPREEASTSGAPATDDTGGASPDEAMADATETPHPVTTPDDPATVVDVEGGAGEEPRP